MARRLVVFATLLAILFTNIWGEDKKWMSIGETQPMESKNVIKDKSFDFAISTVRLYQKLTFEKREFVIAKQLLRSGTSVGAMIREAEQAESKKDFIHKMSIAQKEINETLYWLELLHATNFLEVELFQKNHHSALEILKLLTAIIKTTKSNLPR